MTTHVDHSKHPKQAPIKATPHVAKVTAEPAKPEPAWTPPAVKPAAPGKPGDPR